MNFFSKFLLFIIFTTGFSITFAQQDDESFCLPYSNEQELCLAVDCHFLTFTNRSDPADIKTLCVSLNRFKKCTKLSDDIHKCQRKGCYYDFPRNLCYPKILRIIPENYQFSTPRSATDTI
jgi:hypothetical protein